MAHGLKLLEQGFGIRPKGIVHVGANTGQEVPVFRDSGTRPVVLVEPLADAFAQLERKVGNTPGFYLAQACLSDVADRKVDFHVASNRGRSSSYLPPAEHVTIVPGVTFDRVETMTTDTLDRTLERLSREHGLDPAGFDYIGLDTQGAEMDILRGAPEAVRAAKYVYTEVNFGNLYAGDTGLYDMIALMRGWGFDLYNLSMSARGWGDALFIRREAVAKAAAAARRRAPSAAETGLLNLAPSAKASQSSTSRWSRADDASGALRPHRRPFGFHTDLDDGPWWILELEASVRPERIVVHNRRDTLQERASALIVEASLDGVAWTPLHRGGHPFGAGDGSGTPLVLPLAGERELRFLRLRLPDRSHLHLGWVEVWVRDAESVDARPAPAR